MSIVLALGETPVLKFVGAFELGLCDDLGGAEYGMVRHPEESLAALGQ